jgi:ATP/maltotriose-dependent transcriptional regulator MalT
VLWAWSLLWRGQVEEALVRAKAAEELRQRLGGYPFIGNDLPLLMSVIYLARGDLDAAGMLVDTLIKRAEKAGRCRMMLHIHAAGRTLALLGRYEEALIMQQRLENLLDDDFPLTNYLFNHLKGLLALLGGKAEASDILQRASDMEVKLPMAHVGGSARLLKARLLLDQGKPDEAFDAAYPVLNEWHNASTPGCVLFDGPVILPVLRLAAGRDAAGAEMMLGLFSGELSAAKNSTPAPADNVPENNNTLKGQLTEPLTPRECDVLKLLIVGRTNIQISDELHVSSETVKSHVEHIFRKLDVRSRTQAVIRARELGF